MDTSDQDDGLLKTLFKESFQETWKDSSDFALYLAELSASSLEKLSREPERLAEEKAQILEQTEHLAFHNYKTFIKTAECSKEIFHDFVSVESHVESLLDKLPRFSETCSNFMKAAQEINSSRHLNSLTLARHTQLLEILEISQLMDSCVRNGYYEEALELSSYVHRLEKKLSNIPIIQNIVEVVQSSTQLMLSQLLQQLRSAIQLPACLRVIGYLRRLDMFSESELRIKFLQARDAWLQSVLASIPSDDPYYHITKTIETSRVHLFDIVTQYRAIFSDDDPILSMENEDSPMYSNLFHCWVVQKVQQFLKTLEYDLERGVGSRLDSLLGQCMYFGLSFSRVGADFRGLLPPLFHTAAMKAFSTAVLDATERFNETMKSYSPRSLSSSVTATMLSTMTAKKLLREMGTSFRRNDFWDRFGWAGVAYDWFMVALNTIDQSSNEKSLHSVLVPILLGVSKPDDTGADLHPPSSLLQHPPLAAFTNSVLSAFNELRHCAPLAIVSPVTEVLQSSFASVIHVTCAFHRAEAAALNESERATFANFCQVLGKQLIPYINRCLEAIFPSSALSVLQGGPTAASTSLRLDVQRLHVLLEPVMPQESTEEEEKLRGEQDVKSRPSIPQDTTGETEQPRHENEAEREKRKEQKNTDQEKEHLTEQSVETESLNDGGEKVSESEQQEPDLT